MPVFVGLKGKAKLMVMTRWQVQAATNKGQQKGFTNQEKQKKAGVYLNNLNQLETFKHMLKNNPRPDSPYIYQPINLEKQIPMRTTAPITKEKEKRMQVT